MYTHLGKSLAIAVSSLTLLSFGGYVHAEEAAKAESAQSQPATPTQATTSAASADSNKPEQNPAT